MWRLFLLYDIFCFNLFLFSVQKYGLSDKYERDVWTFLFVLTKIVPLFFRKNSEEA